MSKLMPKLARLGLAAMLLFAVSACAAGSQASLQAAGGGSISSLVLGFWHGIIAPVTILGEIIDKVSPGTLPWSLHLYETRNSGVLYDVGFFVGLIAGPSMFWTGLSRRRAV